MGDIQDYITLVDHILTGKKIKAEPETYSIPKPRNPIAVIENGEIKELMLNQSFVKRIYWTGPPTSYIGSWELLPTVCPRQVYEVYIARTYKFPKTLSMLLGEYFETHCIGGGAYGKTLYLPRNTRTGEPLAVEKQITAAVGLFKKVAEETDIQVNANNTQVEMPPIWITDFPDIKIYHKGTADIISPFHYQNLNYDVCVLDLKLTNNRNESFFKPKEPWMSFCWGQPEAMSQLQATSYSVGFQLPFVNLVFDYQKDNSGWKPVPVKTIISHPDDNEARLRYQEFKEGIRKVILTLLEWNEYDWPEYKGVQCVKCPCSGCPQKKIIEHY